MKSNRVNSCMWCGKITTGELMMVPKIPILEFMERKIDMLGRDRVWGEESNWSELEMDSNDEAELLIYDDLLNDMVMKRLCDQCIEDDERLTIKYYGEEEE